MRFLWVEDFDGDSPDKDIKYNNWIQYFEIEKPIVIENLEDALFFLDESTNLNLYDGVLIDIRFPIFKRESSKNHEDIYHEYFQQYITWETYSKYTGGRALHDASAGILLYLALVYRYNYHCNKIAFISANIDDAEFLGLVNLKELLTKAKFEKLNNSDYKLFYKNNGNLAKTYKDRTSEEIPFITTEELFKRQESASKDEFVDVIEEQLSILNSIREQLNLISENETEVNLKYCSVKREFNKIGLKLPAAFEKPVNQKDKSWAFHEWKSVRQDEITILKRNIIDMCKMLRDELDKRTSLAQTFLNLQRKYNDEDSEITIDTMRYYLSGIENLLSNEPSVLSESNKREYYRNILDDIASIWESINPYSIDNNAEFSLYGICVTMKLVRNWLAHQGINGIDAKSVAFIFILSMRGCFELKSVEGIEDYSLHEKKLLQLFCDIRVDYALIDKKNAMEVAFSNSRNRFMNQAVPEKYQLGKPGKMREPNLDRKDCQGVISALGHSDSMIRTQMSTTEVYRLFWMALHMGKEYTSKLHIVKEQEVISILECTYNLAFPDLI